MPTGYVQIADSREDLIGHGHNSAILEVHDYSEAETRDYFIDPLLKEAGWSLDKPRDREFPVTGMPTESGEGFVDYVMWADDGKPLALVGPHM